MGCDKYATPKHANFLRAGQAVLLRKRAINSVAVAADVRFADSQKSESQLPHPAITPAAIP